MPVFDFECKNCGNVFEKTVKLEQKTNPDCPECKSKKIQKLLSVPGIIFKGSGFYKTDSKKADECKGCCKEGKCEKEGK